MQAPDDAHKKIVILSSLDLARNPRVLKEATALSRAGYAVTVMSVWSDDAHDEGIQLAVHGGFEFKPVTNFSNANAFGRIRSLRYRIRSKLGRELWTWLGVENRYQLGYVGHELWRAADKLKATLYISHLEQGTWAAMKLASVGQRVGVDMEDWYSEDLLPEARMKRPLRLLRELEQRLLRTSNHSSCPSRAMSEALAREFDCRPPAVIYNAFEWAQRNSLDGLFKDRQDHRVPSIHWVSQTLGPGRGLEDLFGALPNVRHGAEIHLRGNPVPGFEEWIASRVPDSWRKQIFVHELVSNRELLSRIAEHDIGFAGEMKHCRSRDLTVTNKILHYLLAGLAVVASDTAGQREVAARVPGGVLTYPSGESLALAERLNELLASADRLVAAKAAALRAAEDTFCWEKMAPVLVKSVESALKCKPSPRQTDA